MGMSLKSVINCANSPRFGSSPVSMCIAAQTYNLLNAIGASSWLLTGFVALAIGIGRTLKLLLNFFFFFFWLFNLFSTKQICTS